MNSKIRNMIIIATVIAVAIGIYVYKNREIPKQEPVKVVEENTWPKHEVVGKSVQGRNIDSYTFGKGKTQIAFVGGVHGGYEWNSVLLAYKFMDYLEQNKNTISENLSITVIPNANPDGVYKVVGKEGDFGITDVSTVKEIQESGRFNANNVDLNRNFDCKWKPEATWRSKKVSAGTKAFSEPESLAIKNFVEKNNPKAIIFWHSQANAVYASECLNGILPETRSIMNLYSKASGYKSVDSFDAYPVTGDAEGWLASIGIPAITVELSTHESIEWEKNLLGIKALLDYYKNK